MKPFRSWIVFRPLYSAHKFFTHFENNVYNQLFLTARLCYAVFYIRPPVYISFWLFKLAFLQL